MKVTEGVKNHIKGEQKYESRGRDIININIYSRQLDSFDIDDFLKRGESTLSFVC